MQAHAQTSCNKQAGQDTDQQSKQQPEFQQLPSEGGVNKEALDISGPEPSTCCSSSATRQAIELCNGPTEPSCTGHSGSWANC